MGVIQTSLCHGPVYFDTYPDLTLSFSDRNLFEAITLKLQTKGYNFLKGSNTIGVIYRIHYKVMNIICPNAILHSNPGKTVVIDSNCLNTNIAVPRLIKWEEIEFPDEWTIDQAVPPTAVTDNQVDQIVQNNDGDVVISFAPNQVSRLTLPRSMSSRYFQRNTPYNVSLAPSRHSVRETYN
jgi:hypothetical protein